MASGWRRARARLRRPDAVGALRRNAAAAVDGVCAPLAKRWSRVRPVPMGPDDDPRVALVTVNFSTTRYLKLMLATLAEQAGIGLVGRVVIVDNDSRDGGRAFLRALERRVPRITLVERHRFPSHARGMRAGVAALRRVERTVPPAEHANFLLFVDTDVIWRNPDALLGLVGVALAHDAVLGGEWRAGANPAPDIQASLFLVRRDAYDDRRTPPPVVGGSPAYRLQRSLVDRGLPVVDFPANRGGYTLHRGRSGVAAAAGHPRHPYARATRRDPHYMGVPDGARIWAAAEAAHAALLTPEGEPALLDLLAARLNAPDQAPQ